ncbi:MAG: flagellar basal body rod protein FlgB [Clostridiales bacterium]|nr:flagellar basal body rod protein FlgB [Clostridiales bacterium]
MWDKLYAPADLLQQGLSATWTRNAVIRNNLANSETPNFKASELDFETLLAQTLEQNSFTGRRTRERHLQIGGPQVGELRPVLRQSDQYSMRMDGNNVDVEAENVKLAQNSLQYNTLLVKLNSELSRLRMAINEGR